MGADNTFVLIKWFNVNSGFILVILTGIYVLTTVGLLLSSHRLNKMTNRSMVMAIRPYVTIDLFPDGDWIYLRIKNIGVLPARDIIISFDKDINMYLDKKLSNVVNNISGLGPNISHVLTLDKFSDFFRNNKDIREVVISVSYESYSNISFSDSITLDLNYYSHVIRSS